MKSKKASLGIVMMIVLILISAFVVYSITAKFLSIANTGMQSTICKANMVGAWSSNRRDTEGLSQGVWQLVSSDATKSLMQHPLCTTQVKVLDYSKKNGDDPKVVNDFGRELGEMIEACWKEFGSGKLDNTFNNEVNKQKKGGNFYFPCYRFKVILNDQDIPISGSKVYGVPNGYLWTHGLNGAKLDFLEKEKIDVFNSQMFEKFSKQAFNDEEKFEHSYASNVAMNGYGYLEFTKKTLFDKYFGIDVVGNGGVARRAGGAAIGGVGALSLAALTVGTGGIGLAFIAAGVGIGAVAGAFDIANPNAMSKLAENNIDFYSDVYYEVRYYSPYFGKPGVIERLFNSKADVSYLTMNNIKVVPITETSSGALPISAVNTNFGDEGVMS